jgi:hypothetical protein
MAKSNCKKEKRKQNKKTNNFVQDLEHMAEKILTLYRRDRKE